MNFVNRIISAIYFTMKQWIFEPRFDTNSALRPDLSGALRCGGLARRAGSGNGGRMKSPKKFYVLTLY